MEGSVRPLYRLFMIIVLTNQISYGVGWESLSGPPGGDVTCVFVDHDSTLWIGTGSSGGVYVLDKDSDKWVERNRGIGISHIYKLIEVDDIMYSQLRKNEDLDMEVRVSKTRKNEWDYFDEDRIEKILTNWYYYDTNRESWIVLPETDFEYEIVTSEYQKWKLENITEIKSVLKIETNRNNEIIDINGSWFSTNKNHFPPNIKIDNITITLWGPMIHSKSGLYIFQTHKNMKPGKLLDSVNEYKENVLKRIVEENWIPPIKESFDKGDITEGKYDTSVSVQWEYYDNFRVFRPIQTSGLICSDPKQIIDLSHMDTNFVEYYDYIKEDTVMEKHPYWSEKLMVQLDNSVWIYKDGDWDEIFSGYFNHFDRGKNYFVSHLEEISRDSILIFSEGDMFLYSQDSLRRFLNQGKYKNTKTSDSLSTHFISCNIDPSGNIWSIIKSSRNYWLIRLRNEQDPEPLFITRYDIPNESRNQSEYQIFKNRFPFILRGNNGILWLFSDGEVRQIGSGYDRNLVMKFGSGRYSNYLPRELVVRYKNNGVMFLEYGQDFIRPKKLISWTPDQGRINRVINEGYYFSSIIPLTNTEVFMSTGYGPVYKVNYCDHEEIMSYENPGLVRFSLRNDTIESGTYFRPPNRWVLSSSYSEVNDIYIGTSGSGVLKLSKNPYRKKISISENNEKTGSIVDSVNVGKQESSTDDKRKVKFEFTPVEIKKKKRQ